MPEVFLVFLAFQSSLLNLGLHCEIKERELWLNQCPYSSHTGIRHPFN